MQYHIEQSQLAARIDRLRDECAIKGKELREIYESLTLAERKLDKSIAPTAYLPKRLFPAPDSGKAKKVASLKQRREITSSIADL
jgi:hypothetical protein